MCREKNWPQDVDTRRALAISSNGQLGLADEIARVHHHLGTEREITEQDDEARGSLAISNDQLVSRCLRIGGESLVFIFGGDETCPEGRK